MNPRIVELASVLSENTAIFNKLHAGYFFMPLSSADFFQN